MRKSILTEYEEISAFSGKSRECDHHLIMGRGTRELCEKDGLYIPMQNCEHNCSPNGLIHQIHENPAAEKLSKMLGQVAWEKEYLAKKLDEMGVDARAESREKFMKRYGQSWL